MITLLPLIYHKTLQKATKILLKQQHFHYEIYPWSNTETSILVYTKHKKQLTELDARIFRYEHYFQKNIQRRYDL